MRKFYLLLAYWFVGFAVQAQIPNSDFENWTNEPTLVDWVTNSHPLTLPPWDPYIVRQDSGSYTGKWAADLHANGVLKPYAKTTFAVPYHPKRLSLYYKVSIPPCVNDHGYFEKDTVSVIVELLNNGVVVDSGYWESLSTHFSWSQLLVPITQNASIFDSCRITLWGGRVFGGCGIIAASTEFVVDHLQLLYSDSNTCIDSSLICACPCFALYDPVCGCDGKTYTNWCFAHSAGNTSWTQGACFAGCKADFTYTAVGKSVSFSNASIPSDSITTTNYYFGDGDSAIVENPTHTYAHTGSYTVCLKMTTKGGCLDSICKTIAVAAGGCIDSAQICDSCMCTAVFDPVCGCNNVTYSNSCEAYNAGVTTWTAGACTACHAEFTYVRNGFTVSFINNSTSIDSITRYFYNFGDGDSSTDANPAEVFPGPGRYSICLFIASKTGCTDSFCISLTIPVPPCIDSSQICNGCVCTTDYDPVCGCDGKTYTNSCEAYNAGNTYWTSGLCSGSCHADFDFIINGKVVSFTNTSASADSIISTYYDFGNGHHSNDPNPIETFGNSGTQTVCLVIVSVGGCSDSICKSVDIPLDSTCIDSSQICDTCVCPKIYAPVCGCNNITYGNNCYAFKAGVKAYTAGPCIGYAGCQSLFSFTRHIDTVSFSNASTATVITAYHWDFGDGHSDTAANPMHVYTHDSTYQVCLSITSLDSAGQPCNNQLCDTVLVTSACIDSSLLCGFPLCCDFAPPIPVCGCDSVTYPSACAAEKLHGVSSYHQGPCLTGIKEARGLVSNALIVPNPAGDKAEMRFEILQAAMVNIVVKNLLGETITTVALGKTNAGSHYAELDLRDLTRGVYIVEMNVNGSVSVVRKLVKE